MHRGTLLALVPLILAAAIADGVAAETSGNTVLTTSAGTPVEYNDTQSLYSDIFSNEHYLDAASHLVRERIPERTQHAKGTGAFGYFEVTNDISSICKAKLFSEVGKNTPIVMRFSMSFANVGAADTTRDTRGLAVKFYTEDGNFDITALSTPIFSVKDPFLAISLIHAGKPSPVNHVKDLNMKWDFATQQPEGLFTQFFTQGDPGIPDGYRHMPAWPVHTYQFVNEKGESNFGRFHFYPDCGAKYLHSEEAAAIGGKYPDYFVQDLYDAIENGNFPSWTMSVQILSMDDVKNAAFDVFDNTKILPLDQYPLTEVGRLVLNRNPTNHFASIEQLAFNPGNMVPGVVGSPDQVFQARRVLYRDAQNYRLGANHHNIEVNCPLQKAIPYIRDGVPPINQNGGDSPNYYPNSFDVPAPYIDENRVQLLKVYFDDSKNFDQMTDYYTNEMADDEKERFIQNLVAGLNNTKTFIQERAVTHFTTVHQELGSRLKQELGLV